MTPEELQNSSLLELFRLEAEAQAAVLNAGLLQLEREPGDATQLEQCMRAAHSLKGAARIVDLADGVRIAHVMEDLLVAAQEKRLRLAAAHIDALLQGTDLLLQIGGGNDVSASVAEQVARLQDLLQGPAEAPPLAAAAEARAEPAAPQPPPTAEPGGSDDLAAEERVSRSRALRVSAEHLDHILDISAKSLIEFQQVAALRASLDRLKQLQHSAGSMLDAYREASAGMAQGMEARELLAEARTMLRDCQHGLQQHLNAFEDFSWAGTRRSQELYDAALASRMRPFADIALGWQRMVRDLARDLGKRVRLELLGGSTQVDRDVLERLEAPLVHLLRNAVDHGIEPPEDRAACGKPEEGLLRLQAQHRAGMLVLTLSDDGAGVDRARLREQIIARGYADAETAAALAEEELLAFLLLPGFTLRGTVTTVSGRGVGLDAVQHDLRQLRGSLEMTQRPGEGCSFRLEVPLTLSVVRSLVVEAGGEAYAFPLSRIERVVRLPPEEIVQLEGRQQFWLAGRPVGLLRASQLLQCGEAEAGAGGEAETEAGGIPVVLIGDRQQQHGIAVERVLGERSLVVVPLDPRFGKIRDVAAGALLDDGHPALILDVDDLLGTVGKLLGAGALERVDGTDAASPEGRRKRVLVVDDSLTVRELERKLLAARGYDVAVAVDGMEGWNLLRAEAFDLLVTDIDMPRMDGIELVTRLRANAHMQSLPVMVVSYKDREEDRRRGLEAGADRYLAKSGFHDTTLLDAVESLIGPALE